jgi:hypothetical protein
LVDVAYKATAQIFEMAKSIENPREAIKTCGIKASVLLPQRQVFRLGKIQLLRILSDPNFDLPLKNEACENLDTIRYLGIVILKAWNFECIDFEFLVVQSFSNKDSVGNGVKIELSVSEKLGQPMRAYFDLSNFSFVTYGSDCDQDIIQRRP